MEFSQEGEIFPSSRLMRARTEPRFLSRLVSTNLRPFTLLLLSCSLATAARADGRDEIDLYCILANAQHSCAIYRATDEVID